MDLIKYDRHDILRYCRARKFDIPNIKIMIQGMAEWRAENNIDTILDWWEFPELKALSRALPLGVHKNDKLGRPIFIRRVGMADLDAFFASAPQERMVLHIAWQNEEFKYRVYPALARIHNRHVESNCQIFDLIEGNIRKLMSRQCLALLKIGSKLAQDYYPESMGAAYIVNAPMLFSMLWAIVKGFLDERTRAKVRIFGSNY